MNDFAILNNLLLRNDDALWKYALVAYADNQGIVDEYAGGMLEVRTISSWSVAPYREDEDVGSDFYRYEIRVPEGKSILQLDQFVCHNEDGEVLLPPMQCRVTGMRSGENGRCREIIELEYVAQLACER